MKKGKLTTILLIIMFVAGLGLLLYPTVANLWNARHQSHAVSSYIQEISTISHDEFDRMWQEAEEYNKSLLSNPTPCLLTDEQAQRYWDILDVSGTGIIGYVTIPSIDVMLPIYHGTDSGVLQIAVGHLEWSSFPAPGEGVHCVISGHRGLPSSRLFTDLDELNIGDIFSISVLDKILYYEVDQIRITLPNETSELTILPDRELCTLVTCTPYGINTHRLLVRGHVISAEQQAAAMHITADAVQIDALIVAPVLAIPLLIALLAVLLMPKSKPVRGETHEE